MTNKSDLEHIILDSFPYPIAVRYRGMLDVESFEERARRAIDVYEASLRALTLGILGKYMRLDLEVINDSKLTRCASDLFGRGRRAPALGTWKTAFFTGLKAYKDHRDLFFMPELYDFYWDTSSSPHRAKKKIQGPFDELVQWRNYFIAHSSPTDPEKWKSIYLDIDSCLHDILGQFQFLASYDLIHVVAQGEGGHSYDIYTGQHVTRMQSLLRSQEQTKEQWCYLSRKTGELLPVHPLFIYWENELARSDSTVRHSRSEVVVYDSYSEGQLLYWHSSLGKVPAQDPGLWDLLAQLIERLLAQQKRVIYRLSWLDLKALSSQIAYHRMGDARRKYNPNLYLQRQDTRQTFGDFLRSDSAILILVGNSGVGKSNFLLSLLDEFQNSDGICILPYNGARLAANEPIEDALARDFNHHLRLREQQPPTGYAVLQMIDELTGTGTTRKQVLVFIDALNENPSAKEVLRQIDWLVENRPFPWLKVVVTSRPEAWRTIKRGISLTEHKYFRQHGKVELGVEMTGFDYEIRVLPFPYSELPFVYEKYRNIYNLKTVYDDIPASIKKLLRDPLTLLLVAETYRDRAIPAELRASELIEKYVDTLKKTKRLSERDLSLLEQEIVPRLFRLPFAPILKPVDIHNQYTADGRLLHALIFNDGTLPGGERVNQSYTYLADSAILIEQDQQTEEVIGFKYERFYEYFGGLYLTEAAHDTGDPFRYYENICTVLDDKPYLWGALKNALFQELKNNNFELVSQLARLQLSSERLLLRSAIVSSIVEFYELGPRVVRQFIEEMIQPLYGPAQNFSETVRRLAFRRKYDVQMLNREQAIAVEIAGRLGFEDLLTRAAADRVGSMRQTAILHIYHLWRTDADSGWRIAEQLTKHAVTAMDLPDPGVLDSLASLIISILTSDHTNPQSQKHALQAGRRILRRLLLLDPHEHRTLIGRVKRVIAERIRQPLLTIGFNWGIKIISSWSQENLPANFMTLSNFFRLSESDKSLATPLTPYFNPYKSGLSTQVQKIMAAEETGDFITLNIIGVPIIARAQVNSEDGISALRDLVNQRLSQSPPPPWIEGYLWIALQMALRQRPRPDPELLELGKRCALAIQSDPYSWLKSHQQAMAVPFLWNTSGVGNYMALAYIYNGQGVTSDVTEWITRALEQGDREYLLNYITKELILVFEMGFHRIALDGLRLIAKHPDKELQSTAANLLIRIRRYFPADVEDLLLQEVFQEDVSKRVWRSSPTERANDLLGMRAVGVLYDIFLLGPDVLRQETIWLANQARKMPNLEAWVVLFLKEMLNLAAGEAIFTVPEESPSRLLLNS
jgi:hypothetical protein